MGQPVGLSLRGIVLVLLVERLLALRNRLKASIEVGSVDLLNSIEAGSEDSDILPNDLAFFPVGLQCPVLHSFAPDMPGGILVMDVKGEKTRGH